MGILGSTKLGWVGVDVGGGAVKTAQLTRRRNRCELTGAAIVPRRSSWDMVSDDAQQQPSSTDEILTALSLADTIRGRAAAGVLSMKPCRFHSLKIESQDPSPQQVHKELVTSSPGRWQDRTYDVWSVRHPSDSTRRPPPSLGAISLPTSWATRTATDLAQAHLDCKQLDSSPTAIGRALRFMVGGQDVAIATLDWGSSRGVFSATRDCRPLYVRPLKGCAFADVASAVTDRIGCSGEQAMLLIQQHGLARPGAGSPVVAAMVRDVMLPFAEQLVEELERTLRYLTTHRGNLSPNGVVLFGAGATVRGFSTFLTERLSLPTKVWAPHSSSLEIQSDLPCPLVLLAPALAASALAWEKR